MSLFQKHWLLFKSFLAILDSNNCLYSRVEGYLNLSDTNVNGNIKILQDLATCKRWTDGLYQHFLFFSNMMSTNDVSDTHEINPCAMSAIILCHPEQMLTIRSTFYCHCFSCHKSQYQQKHTQQLDIFTVNWSNISPLWLFLFGATGQFPTRTT